MGRERRCGGRPNGATYDFIRASPSHGPATGGRHCGRGPRGSRRSMAVIRTPSSISTTTTELAPSGTRPNSAVPAWRQDCPPAVCRVCRDPAFQDRARGHRRRERSSGRSLQRGCHRAAALVQDAKLVDGASVRVTMAILATLFGLVGRYTGRLLTTTLGWASTLLFGRVPQNKQVLLVAVPLPDFVDPLWVRLAKLAGAIVLPLAVGFVIRLIPDAAERPTGRAAIADILRGYPLAAGLAVTLVFLAVVAVVTKARSVARRWADAHVPIVVKPGGYEKMVRDLEDALDQTGLGVSRRAAPMVLSVPGQLLAASAGGSVRSLVPTRIWVLVRPDLEVTLHPSDILVAGTGLRVAQARAAIAARLTTTSAHLTTSAESRGIEDRIEAIAPGPSVDPAPWGTPNARELREIDQALSQTMLPYDEWEILYRMRLQVERDLLRAARGGRVEPATGEQTLAGPSGSGRSSRRPFRPTLPTPVSAILAVGSVALVALDLILALAQRGTGERRR